MGLRYRRVQKPVPWLKSNLMRFVVALLSFALLSGAAAQQSHRYMGTDARVGVHPRYGWPIIPGVNCVQGHQRFFSEQGFWDVQYGVGLPNVVTMKVGGGFKSAKSGRSLAAGLRLWPGMAYVELGFPRLYSTDGLSKNLNHRMVRREIDRSQLLNGEWLLSVEAALLFLYNSSLPYALNPVGMVALGRRWYMQERKPSQEHHVHPEYDEPTVKQGECQANRHFLMPSALQLREGQLHVQSNLISNVLDYGLTDWFSVGAAAGLFGVWGTAQVSVPLGDKTRASAGMMGGAGLGIMQYVSLADQWRNAMAFGHLGITRGDRNRNVSMNLGLTSSAFFDDRTRGYVDLNPSEHLLNFRAMVFNLNAMWRLNNRLQLITENVLITHVGTEVVRRSDGGYVSYQGVNLTEATSASDLVPNRCGFLSLGIRNQTERSPWFYDLGLAVGSINGLDGLVMPWFSWHFKS